MKTPTFVLDACLESAGRISTFPVEVQAFAESLSCEPSVVVSAWRTATNAVQGIQDPRARQIARKSHLNALLEAAPKIQEKHYIAPKSEAVTQTLLGAILIGPEHAPEPFNESNFAGGLILWDGGEAVTRFNSREGFKRWFAEVEKTGIDPDIVAMSAEGEDLPAFEDMEAGGLQSILAQLVAQSGPAALTEYCKHYRAAVALGVKRKELAAMYAMHRKPLAEGIPTFEGRQLHGPSAKLFFTRRDIPSEDSARFKWIAEHTKCPEDEIVSIHANARKVGFPHADAWVTAIHYAAVGGKQADLMEVSSRSDALVLYVSQRNATGKMEDFEKWLSSEYPALANSGRYTTENPGQVFAVPADLLVECDKLSIKLPQKVDSYVLDSLAFSAMPKSVQRWALNSLTATLRLRENHSLNESTLNRLFDQENSRMFAIPDKVRYSVKLGRMYQRQHGVPVRESHLRTSELLIKTHASFPLIRRISRLQHSAISESEKDPAFVSFMLRGGRPGVKWARSIVAEVAGARVAAAKEEARKNK